MKKLTREELKNLKGGGGPTQIQMEIVGCNYYNGTCTIDVLYPNNPTPKCGVPADPSVCKKYLGIS